MANLLQNEMLVNALISLVQPEIKKEAQATPAPDPEVVKALATKMVSNLEKQSSVTAEKSDASLYMRDLQNLGTLISFLKIENMQFDGKMIVVDNYAALSDEDKKLYVPYRLAAGFEAMPATTTVGIYKDGLIGYLRSLQSHAGQAGGPQAQLLNTMVGKLIDQANTELKLGMSAAEPSKTEVSTVADNTPLDSVHMALLYDNPLIPSRDKGSISITPKDLKSKSGFDAFARKISLKKGDKVIAYEDFTDANFCDLIHVLMVRAQSYEYRRGAEVDKVYLQLVTDLAGQYQCPVTGVGDAAKSTTPTAYKPEEGKLTAEQYKTVRSIGVGMPLLGDRIDLQRIKGWLNKYSQLNPDPSAADSINRAVELIDGIMSTYRISTQPLSQEADAIISDIIAKMPANVTVAEKAGAPQAYLRQLYTVISLVGRILGDFKSKIYDMIPEQDTQFRRWLDTQIGSGGSSYYNVNIDKINNWIMDLPTAMQAIRTRGF